MVLWDVEFKSKSSENVYFYVSDDTWAAEGAPNSDMQNSKGMFTNYIVLGLKAGSLKTKSNQTDAKLLTSEIATLQTNRLLFH